jgi:hypothetical protein
MAEDFIQHVDASTLCMLMGMCLVARPPTTNPMFAATTTTLPTTATPAKSARLRAFLPAVGRLAQSVHRTKAAAFELLTAPGTVRLGDVCDSCKVGSTGVLPADKTYGNFIERAVLM